MNRLREIRRQRGLNQAKLADLAGMSPITVSRLETGERLLKEDTAIDLARALKCQPGDLMPLITDGSVPLETDLSRHQLSALYETLAFFMEIHAEADRPTAERLAMAAIKLFQMNLAGLKEHPFFDTERLRDSQDPDQNTP